MDNRTELLKSIMRQTDVNLQLLQVLMRLARNGKLDEADLEGLCDTIGIALQLPMDCPHPVTPIRV